MSSLEPTDLGPHYTMSVTGQGVIDIIVHGVWKKTDVDGFFTALTDTHLRASQFGPVRMLITVDRVQSPTIAFYTRTRVLAIKRSGDRNAVIVASVLSRLQITRLAGGEGFRLFTDRSAALAWLTAP